MPRIDRIDRTRAMAALLGTLISACVPGPVAPPRPQPGQSLPNDTSRAAPAARRAQGQQTTAGPEPGPASVGTLAHSFVRVPLPQEALPILAIAGRDRNDVWVLAGEAENHHLVQLGSSGVVRLLPAKPCFPFGFEWSGLTVEQGEFQLYGNWQQVEANLVRSVFNPDKPDLSECDTSPRVAGLDCPWFHAWGSSGDARDCTLGETKMPEYDPISLERRHLLEVSAASLKGPDDGWLFLTVIQERGQRIEIHRYNGVTWALTAVIPAELRYRSHWLDDTGRGWLLVAKDDEDPGEILFRLDHHSADRVAVPPEFAASMVHATGPRRVWFVGAGKKVFAWDGEQFRVGVAPFEVTQAWAGPGSDLWIASADAVAHSAAIKGTP